MAQGGFAAAAPLGLIAPTRRSRISTQPRAPFRGAVPLSLKSRTGIKAHNAYATHPGDCAPPSGSRMVTLIYPRRPVVHP
ncbi:hypothetical protein GCM10022233_59880 [Streptomyces shaanxiensis]|uniref:Uncharacterized protein n=1 Tax=Streptomyces shaanxiensis TaxID=653357 RepID=A0ABP7VTD7_9ACTN